METGEIIQPSYILPCKVPVLGYSPSLRCCLVGVNTDVLGFLNIDCRSTVKQIATHELDEVYATMTALSSDSSLLAVLDEHITARADQIRVFSLSIHSTASNCPISPPSFYTELDFGCTRITNIKFFPDCSRFIVTSAGASRSEKQWRGPWCKILTLPDEFWDNSNGCDFETLNGNRNKHKTLVCHEIDVPRPGFPIDEAEIYKETTEEYDLQYYAWKHYGFHGLAISPDTLRVLAGSVDGQVYIIETNSGKLLQCVRAYWYSYKVLGCHYSPVFGHHEFATCSYNGILDIWSVEELDDGTEEASQVHRLKFEPFTSYCSYSPDGNLIALTSPEVLKTYIICSHSGETLYTLVYKELFTDDRLFLQTSSLFIGHSCQVATMHFDNSICFWKLPVVYSLKTLCLLMLRSTVKYNDVDNLPTALKLQLKYLYV